jgi:hypothetical protein
MTSRQLYEQYRRREQRLLRAYGRQQATPAEIMEAAVLAAIAGDRAFRVTPRPRPRFPWKRALRRTIRALGLDSPPRAAVTLPL